MRVFVFTWDRYDSITTSGMLESAGFDHTVLCHSDEHAEQFIAAGRVRPDRLHVTGAPKGLAYNRNACLDLMDVDEWAVWLVDDLMRVTELEDYDAMRMAGELPITTKNASEWARKFRHEVGLDRFMERADALARHTERLGGRLGGFAGYDNALFRRNHWQMNCLADGRAWVVRKSALRFDEHVQMVDDVCWTAQNLDTFGVVAVDQWVLPLCRRYTAGAYGSIAARTEQKRREVAYLVDTYPQWCATRPKKGWEPGTHVVIRSRSGARTRL